MAVCRPIGACRRLVINSCTFRDLAAGRGRSDIPARLHISNRFLCVYVNKVCSPVYVSSAGLTWLFTFDDKDMQALFLTSWK